MRLICFWCFLLGAAVRAQNDFYAPQTFRQQVRTATNGRLGGPALFQPMDRPWETVNDKGPEQRVSDDQLPDARVMTEFWREIWSVPIDHTEGDWMRVVERACEDIEPMENMQNKYIPVVRMAELEGFQRGLFSPAGRDVTPQSTSQTWTPSDYKEPWKAPLHTNTKPEPWRLPYGLSKEQQATILHHKQALTSEGAFRFEYASDNGLAAGEQIEPDGSRVGAYQYKDPSGQLVKLKYRAGKDGFQILEGSHLPKSPEPVAPQTPDNHYQTAYAQQRQQYELQQQYNQQRPEQQNNWRDEQGGEGQRASSGQYFTNWRPQGGMEDDGQYRENEVENKGPHSFGEGYAFAFKG